MAVEGGCKTNALCNLPEVQKDSPRSGEGVLMLKHRKTLHRVPQHEFSMLRLLMAVT